MIFMNQLNKAIKKSANIKNGTILSKVMYDDETDNLKLGDLPYAYSQGSSVVYHGEIHIMGGFTSPRTQHYKWDGETWSEVSTLPFEFLRGCVVVYNDEIHIFGGATTLNSHYKWDGTSWTSVDTTPVNIVDCSAVIYNNEIHFITPLISSYHYKYDGTTWTKLKNTPFTGSTSIQSVVYNNKIYTCGLRSNNKICYSYDGSGWTNLASLPDTFKAYAALVYNNKMHFLFILNDIGYHYTFDGETWEEVGELPYAPTSCSTVVYNNKIHLLGGENGDERVSHYILEAKGIYPHIHISNLGVVNVYASGGFSQSGDDIYVLAAESVPDIFVYDETEENLLYTNKILTYNQTTGKYEIYGYFPTTLKNINATITSSRWQTLRLDTPNLFN